MAPQTINDHIVYWAQANETRLAMIRRLMIGRANYACSSRDIRAILALFNLDLFEKFLSHPKYSGPILFGPLRRVCTYQIYDNAVAKSIQNGENAKACLPDLAIKHVLFCRFHGIYQLYFTNTGINVIYYTSRIIKNGQI